MTVSDHWHISWKWGHWVHLFFQRKLFRNETFSLGFELLINFPTCIQFLIYDPNRPLFAWLSTDYFVMLKAKTITMISWLHTDVTLNTYCAWLIIFFYVYMSMWTLLPCQLYMSEKGHLGQPCMTPGPGPKYFGQVPAPTSIRVELTIPWQWQMHWAKPIKHSIHP